MHVSQDSVERHLVQLDKALAALAAKKAHPSLFNPGVREKALKRSLARALGEARNQASQSRLTAAAPLAEVAQVAAGSALVFLRRPDSLFLEVPMLEEALEPDMEPPAANPSDEQGDIFASLPVAKAQPLEGGTAGNAVKDVLLRCLPAFRLGVTAETLSHILRLSEAPAFFTMSHKEKAFEVSVQSIADTIVAEWLKQPDSPLLRASCVGLGCAMDIDHDDKGIVIAIVVLPSKQWQRTVCCLDPRVLSLDGFSVPALWIEAWHVSSCLLLGSLCRTRGKQVYVHGLKPRPEFQACRFAVWHGMFRRAFCLAVCAGPAASRFMFTQGAQRRTISHRVRH
ncbi:hypothetical protein AK812_SmicGene36001 [Symbiodinium microadriaticum]|uniref:Uncharacterized protein n=2 Tax=Symbiodinium TaxID=2949 RepID=A0A1Q9CK18_SYMMI|nr:hypothetical protein AK812_SmicGene36001 [Symbiodinium microadriaticum]